MDKQAITRCNKRTRLHSCNERCDISAHSSSTCGSRSKLMFFQWIQCGPRSMPKFIAANLQLGHLICRPIQMLSEL